MVEEQSFTLTGTAFLLLKCMRQQRQRPCCIKERSAPPCVFHAPPADFTRQVRELTASVGSLSRAAREAEAAHAHAAHVASTAVSDAASASAATLEDAAAATHAAARAEQHARDAVSQLQLRVQVLRQAHAGELGPPPSASPLLEPLRARQVQLQGELEACGARVAAAQRELQDALEAANEVRGVYGFRLCEGPCRTTSTPLLRRVPHRSSHDQGATGTEPQAKLCIILTTDACDAPGVVSCSYHPWSRRPRCATAPSCCSCSPCSPNWRPRRRSCAPAWRPTPRS